MLAQLSTIKTRLGMDQFDTTDDSQLTCFIKLATGRFERQCNRYFARQANTKEEFAADKTELCLCRYPVESIGGFELKSDETEGWAAQSDVICLLRQACVVSLPGPLGSSAQLLRITYTGGFVLPGSAVGAGQTALPDELEQACVEQVAYWYQNRNRLGLVSVAGEGGSIQQFAQLDLLPHVKAILSFHERLLF